MYYNCTQTYDYYANFSIFSEFSLVNHFCSVIACLSIFKFDLKTLDLSNVFHCFS